MKFTGIRSCYVGPQISPEQFAPEHVFLFLLKGKIEGYDGYRHYTLHPQEACLVRKNHLSRYSKQLAGGEFEKVVIIFDEAFLKRFLATHNVRQTPFHSDNAFLPLGKSRTIAAFIRSLAPHLDANGRMNKPDTEVKRTELLGLLLRLHPEYAAILFDFGVPGRIDLESFMNRNYRFNVSLGRFAFLTGRSLSAFKRDFTRIFHDTPSRWLIARRLREARFLIEKSGRRPADFYLDLGFENLSHFSFAFKKQFGVNPTQLAGRKVKQRSAAGV